MAAPIAIPATSPGEILALDLPPAFGVWLALLEVGFANEPPGVVPVLLLKNVDTVWLGVKLEDEPKVGLAFTLD
jgi:hypothetical protein